MIVHHIKPSSSTVSMVSGHGQLVNTLPRRTTVPREHTVPTSARTAQYARHQTQQVAANRCIIAPDSLASGHFAIVDPVGRAILLPLFACLATNDRAICASILGTRSIGSFPSPPRPDQRPCDINYVVSRCCRIILGPCDTEPDPEVDALVGDAIVGMLCLRCRRGGMTGSRP